MPMRRPPPCPPCAGPTGLALSLALLAPVALVALPACGSDAAACTAGDGRACVEIDPAGMTGDLSADYVAIETALIDATPGDVILLHAGTYHLPLGLSVTAPGVTVRGEGKDATILSFAGQLDGAQGLLATGDDFTVEDLAIEDTEGDGIKTEGANRVAFRRVRVEWTAGPATDNGGYGLYPVQCKNVLIEDSVVKGASDSGIYVGQSRSIVVHRNRVEENVAGIEIENSFDADVYDNVATNNAGGLLVFNLPGLEVENGARTRVFNNEVYENNQPNFAAVGNIVGLVPQGTGFAGLAAHDVEVFGNHFADNQTVNTGIISFQVTQLDWDDPSYVPTSDTLFIHDNVYEGGGDRPSGDLGFLLLAVLGDLLPSPVMMPDVVYDGIKDPDKMDGAGLAAKYNICLAQNGDADFAELDAANDFANPSLDAGPYQCSHPALPEVVLEGVEVSQ